jgi:small subunit ribosomal protein S8
MIITDTLSNLFSTIKNGILSKKPKITQQNSKQSKNILNILIREGFIKSYKITKNNKLEIYLKYKQNENVLYKIQKISKPGKRVYIKNKDLYKKKQGFYILSTSTGVLTDLEAKKINVGGELICKIF